jgi:hypothetical protein
MSKALNAGKAVRKTVASTLDAVTHFAASAVVNTYEVPRDFFRGLRTKSDVTPEPAIVTAHRATRRTVSYERATLQPRAPRAR